MLKQRKKKQRRNQIMLAAGAGIAALALGATVSTLGLLDPIARLPWIGQWMASDPSSDVSESDDQQTSAVLPLVTLSPGDRASRLAELAAGSTSRDQIRARYLLAADLIQQGRGGTALPLLDGLEQDYPLLTPMILVKRAQAYTASGQSTEATATWNELLANFPDDPVAAEALYALGQADPQYLAQAIRQFPAHPRTIDIVQKQLSQNPNQLPLLLVLARHGHYLKDIPAVLNRLTTQYASQLQPDDWEAIAFAYWENQYYGSAGAAYEKASNTPLNMYRAGRGAQLGERRQDAIAAYQQVAQAFPDSEEAAMALIKLAEMSGSQTAIAYLDRVPDQFPEKVAEALLAKANAMEQLSSPQSATVVRQSVLNEYSSAEATAQYRWRQAERHFQAGNLETAWQWAQQVVNENPESEYAPEAGFWVGKWATQLGREQEARKAYEYVLTHYPESYYAWRSATLLGWDVGDFTTVRQQLPDVVKPTLRPIPPAGSALLQELYQLGQDRDAWSLWQVEFTNVMQPTVAEQFTDGLMRLGVGNHLDGIFMVSSLTNREKPDDKTEYRSLKQKPSYWQALYPFPFMDTIETWSQQRQLNPMLVTALIRQESRFEPAIESVAGATGLMQVMPGTAEWVAQQIGMPSYSVTDPNDNIALGTWYLKYTHQEYSDNSLFAVASYNAGPGNVADWITRFGFTDPDLFVEQIPFPETKGYVELVFENYWNYLRLYNPDVSQKLADYSDAHSAVVRASLP
ncbi:transglycosylase SLT domain-containing protein [Oculatella sp. LEGE 06141]|uniref:transglycosylase SLT domain-containing protein n=1 Tax=Oculatella sp. LEGE 06141 TaxID=1828648 RepID=UPI0018818DF2|nr:transglycosylase SLT domain-containing protein [Oculatella sp. LEGE 06141]MBE9179081.1 transglycosylase SLT domain-containing protein [Oculatella sp. LEGE 06141]